MKVLWITNVLFPEALSLITGHKCSLQGSGGWLMSAANKLLETDDLEIIVAAPSNLVKTLTKVCGQQMTYYALPCRNERRYNKQYEAIWRKIVSEEKPNIVHIYGTEFAHGLAFCRAKTDIPHVLSIQGISEEIGNHYLDGMSCGNVIHNTSLFDLLYAGTLFKQQRRYIDHGRNVERELIRSSKHIIGRTSFDRSHICMINPLATYYKCNEILRPTFYTKPFWDYDECSKHSIFLSQCNYPIKGLHQVLRAMPYVLKNFPDAHIRIAGNDILSKGSFRQRLTQSTYARFIMHLIKKLNLEQNVCFMGPLDAEQMKREYLRCNVFVSPSSIENSPNSLGEAQLLGVPCVGSYVGGTPDMIPNEKCGILYRASDIMMLADAICSIFSRKWDCVEEQAEAQKRHHVHNNIQAILSVYNSIIG